MASRRAKPRQNERADQRIRDAAAEIYRVIRAVTLDEITVLNEVQVRVNGLDEARVEQYVEYLLAGGAFKDPIDLFQDGQRLILSAGWHRTEAYRRALDRFEPSEDVPALATLKAEIHPGGLDGAIEWAEEDNLAHGLELSPRDKRNILERRFKRGHEWASLSNRALAAKLGVSDVTIMRWRAEIEGEPGATNVAPGRVGKDGKTYDTGGMREKAEAAWRQLVEEVRAELDSLALEPLSEDEIETIQQEMLATTDYIQRTIFGAGCRRRHQLPYGLAIELDSEGWHHEPPRSGLIKWFHAELPKWQEEQFQERARQRAEHDFEQIDELRAAILELLAHGPMRSIELMAALGDPAPPLYRQARESLKADGLIIEDVAPGMRVSFRLAEPTPGPGQNGSDWLDTPASKGATPSMAIAANGAPAHSDDHDPALDEAYRALTALQYAVINADDAIRKVLEIRGIRALYALPDEKMREVYKDLAVLRSLAGQLDGYCDEQQEKLRVMSRTGRPYDEDGEA